MGLQRVGYDLVTKQHSSWSGVSFCEQFGEAQITTITKAFKYKTHELPSFGKVYVNLMTQLFAISPWYEF